MYFYISCSGSLVKEGKATTNQRKWEKNENESWRKQIRIKDKVEKGKGDYTNKGQNCKRESEVSTMKQSKEGKGRKTPWKLFLSLEFYTCSLPDLKKQ